IRLARTEGDGWKVPPPPTLPDLVGLESEEHREFLTSRLSPISILSLNQPVNLPSNAAARLPRTYVRRTAVVPNMARSYQYVAEETGWDRRELPSGHCPMINMPDATVELLAGLS